MNLTITDKRLPAAHTPFGKHVKSLICLYLFCSGLERFELEKVERKKCIFIREEVSGSNSFHSINL